MSIQKDFDTFISRLSLRLNQPLPGREAQVKMAPYPVDENRFQENLKRPSRAGGVMILLYPHRGDVYLPLMKRPVYSGAHSGQVSFPGGKFEQQDIDLKATALRETEEEIGVSPERVELIGGLSDLFIIASNFKVSPAVGFTPHRPTFVPDPIEVESVLEVSLTQLMDTSRRGVEKMTFGDYTIHSPYFDVEGHIVWGATAMMLSEFLEVVAEL
jgi:8-oxo-dGTP pyrophosphatase MutT (NUDIX family)